MKFVVRILSVLAVIGLLVNPVSASASLNTMAAAEQVRATAAMSRMGDAPCCADVHAKPDCSKDCHTAMTCTASSTAQLPNEDWSHATSRWVAVDFGRMPSHPLASLAADPPARPPRA